MEIVRTARKDHLELAIEGRLDGYWAQHLATSVGDVMREGTHAVRLNLSKTSYISSAGIGVLVDLYKQFEAVSGSFRVIEPSKQVQHVLEMVGLAPMLTGSAAATAEAPAPQIERREIGGAVFEFHQAVPGAGESELLRGACWVGAVEDVTRGEELV
jgi:anti-anti-sigma factor